MLRLYADSQESMISSSSYCSDCQYSKLYFTTSQSVSETSSPFLTLTM